MTDDLPRRLTDHRNGATAGFTRKYDVKLLARFEEHATRESAFIRERQLKNGNRAWKLKLIESSNPGWLDLAGEIGMLAD
jgi:putative endonuclease